MLLVILKEKFINYQLICSFTSLKKCVINTNFNSDFLKMTPEIIDIDVATIALMGVNI